MPDISILLLEHIFLLLYCGGRQFSTKHDMSVHAFIYVCVCMYKLILIYSPRMAFKVLISILNTPGGMVNWNKRDCNQESIP